MRKRTKGSSRLLGGEDHVGRRGSSSRGGNALSMRNLTRSGAAATHAPWRQRRRSGGTRGCPQFPSPGTRRGSGARSSRRRATATARRAAHSVGRLRPLSGRRSIGFRCSRRRGRRFRRGRGTVVATWSLSPGAIGRFLVPEPLPKRLLYAEPLRRRMRVRFGEAWITDSEGVVLLFEPGRYPPAYFPASDISSDALQRSDYTTRGFVTTLRAGWFPGRSSTDRSRSTRRPRATCSFAVRSRLATWSSICERAGDMGPQGHSSAFYGQVTGAEVTSRRAVLSPEWVQPP